MMQNSVSDFLLLNLNHAFDITDIILFNLLLIIKFRNKKIGNNKNFVSTFWIIFLFLPKLKFNNIVVL